VTGDPSDIVRAVISAYNERDMDSMLARFDPDVVWHTTPGFLWPGPYRGREAVRGLFERWWQGWDTGYAEADELVESNGAVMVSADVHGRSAGDGLDVHVRLTWVFHVREGLIDLVRSYESPAAARAEL
jgi:ketosteroid isomerase-like protein